MVLRLDSTDLRIDDGRLAFQAAHRDAITAHWARASAEKPRLWNGPQFLFAEVACEDGVLRARGHRTDFATFLYWRANQAGSGVVHITGTSLPVTADGALLAVRMAGHTANAGQLYFPSGSLDLNDVAADGRVDVTGNIRRELEEETGLAPPIEAFDADYRAVRTDTVWFLARRCRLSLTFDECERRVRAHQAKTGDDEIAGTVAIRTRSEADALKPHARALALWHFSDNAGARAMGAGPPGRA